MNKIIEQYIKQAAERHAFQIDKTFWLVVKEKPKWMPLSLYRAVIKNLVEIQEHRQPFSSSIKIK